MVGMTTWAMIINLQKFLNSSKILLFAIGLLTLILEVWMIFESFNVLTKVYGEEEDIDALTEPE
jgi:hypothetical protein